MENKCIFSLDTHQVEQILATMADKIAELESVLRYKDERHAADAVEKAVLMDENRRLHELLDEEMQK